MICIPAEQLISLREIKRVWLRKDRLYEKKNAIERYIKCTTFKFTGKEK